MNYICMSYEEGTTESMVLDFIEAIRNVPKSEIPKLTKRLSMPLLGSDHQRNNAVLAYFAIYLQNLDHEFCI